MKPYLTTYPLRTHVGEPFEIYGGNLDTVTNVSIGGTPATIIEKRGKRTLIVALNDTCQGAISVTNPDGTFVGRTVTLIEEPQNSPLEDFLTRSPVVGDLIQSALPAAGAAAIAGTYANVKGAASVTAKAADNLITGAGSLTKRAYDVGVQIGEQLLSGVLSPLGATGGALTRFLGAGARNAGNLVGQGIGAVGTLAKTGAGLAGGAATAGLAGGGALIGSVTGAAVGSAPGWAVGAFVGSAVGLMAAKILEKITAAIGGVIGKIGEAFGTLGNIATSALSSILDILKDITAAASEVSKAILHMSQMVGYSGAQASGMVTTFGFYGMSPSQVSGRFGQPMSPLSTMMGSAMMGLPNPADDPAGFMKAGADKFAKAQQGGPMSIAMFRTMFNAAYGAGADEQFLPAMGMGKERIDKVNSFQQGLGINPATVETIGKDLQMVQGMLSGFATFLKVTFLTGLLPAFQKGLNAIAGYITKNRDKIINGLFDVADWIYSKLPVYVGQGFSLLLKVSQGFVQGLQGFVGVVRDFLKSFQQGQNGFMETVGNILEVIDWLSIAFITVARVIAPVGALIYDFIAVLGNVWIFFQNLILKIVNFLPALALQAMGLTHWANKLQNMQIPYMPLVDPLAVYTKWQNAQPTDLRGQFENFRNSAGLQKTVDYLDTSDRKLGQFDAFLTKYIPQVDQYVTGLKNTQQDRSAEVNALRSIALSSQATAQNTDPTAAAARAAADQQAQAMADMMARALGYYWGYVKDEQVAVALRA